MLRSPRRVTVLMLASVISVWFMLAVWLTQNDVESVFSRVWYFSGLQNSSEAVDIMCYDDDSTNTLEDFTESPIEFDTSIFFLETSCHSASGIHLTPRQACAVESAAKMNPDSQVYVLFPSPIIDNTSNTSPSVQQLFKYPNIRIRHVALDKYFQDTPLRSWYKTGLLRTSHWPRSHASDVLRYLTLWKYGGTYLDLDVVVTRSLKGMLNFAGAESATDVAAGVLSFSHEGPGHEMAADCLSEIKNDFRGYDWGYNGPGVITRVLQRICNIQNVEEMKPERCKGFTVYPPKWFYPIPWRKWKLYFDTSKSNETLKHLKDSHVIHVWNKFSTAANITTGSTQPYAVIASRYCPNVYKHVGTVF